MKLVGKKTVLWLAVLVLAAGLGLGGYIGLGVLEVGSGYKAKIACSSIFLAGRGEAEVMNQDVGTMWYISANVNHEDKTVAADVLGLARQRAVYRPGYGCTLALGVGEDVLRAQSPPEAYDISPDFVTQPWPAGQAPDRAARPGALDMKRLSAALDEAFSEPDPDNLARTRAVVVAHDGRLVMERYAPGITPKTRLLGWSMTKTVINALVGILVEEGRLDLDAPAPVPEWRGPGDPRGAITLRQLMAMTSGLAFTEIYFPPADATTMLFLSPSTAAFAASQPLAHPPGQVWAYSSGTSNIISRIVKNAVGGSLGDYARFARTRLFGPARMYSALVEPDPSGTLVGSSFGYATARDWARFGQLYLDMGSLNGQRILSPQWVRYTITPAPAAPQGIYGAQIWLNAGAPENPQDRWMPSVPPDMFTTRGHEGQYVSVIPSLKLVVVRLGLAESSSAWDQERFLASVIQAVRPN